MWQSKLPIVFEYSDHHKPGGMNALYMDGHVSFWRFREGPENFPATPKFLAALDGLVKLHQSLPNDRATPPPAESTPASHP
jgi:prepilin-type processing-associated H-X9-DG protein